ncbi:MAG: 30S ribosomal protein S5 [Patescibacteria group bacterium]|nr:30S ribosomal protein S5 [Patescibacteria group bacterium]
MSKTKLPPVSLEEEFEQRLIDLARVTRVVAGGKRLRFRACVVIGNRAGKVGYGLAKGNDVAVAMEKAIRQAKKNIIEPVIVNETIPYEIREKFKAAKIILKPAAKGKGIKAGGAIRIILELAGIKNATAKILGSKNKINNVKATFKALEKMTKMK